MLKFSMFLVFAACGDNIRPPAGVDCDGERCVYIDAAPDTSANPDAAVVIPDAFEAPPDAPADAGCDDKHSGKHDKCHDNHCHM